MRILLEDLGQVDPGAHLIEGHLHLMADPLERPLDVVEASELVDVFQADKEVAVAEVLLFGL